MAKKGSKLLEALDRYKGVDHKLERQKKLQKDAQKRKRAKGEKQPQDAEPQVVKKIIQEKNTGLEDGGADSGTEDEWESDVDTDEEAEAGFDLSRLEDSDSDSEEDGEDSSAHPVKDLLANLKANGIPTATAVHDPKADAADDATDDAADDAVDDIPLSDLSDTGSATEDLIPHQRLTINNTAALTRAVTSIALPTSLLSFSDHQSLTTSAPVTIPDTEDDLARELAFYSQSLSAATEARRLLAAEGIPFTRPPDYFAEMVKSDEHMGRIKAKLTDDAAGKRAAADARKQRDLKRFGKQVQQEKLKERAVAKRDMLDKVNILKRKRQGAGLDTAGEESLFDVALEDAATTERKDKEARRKGGGAAGRPARGGVGMRGRGGAVGGRGKGMRERSDSGRGDGPPNAKRAKKDGKFGFGGKKRFAKSGDAASSGDMTGFSTNKMKGKSRGGSQRLGKSRRAKVR